MKNKVIVDIDGTLSKVGDRLKYLHQKPADWDAFYNNCFEDEPIKEICELVENLSYEYDVFFCTGRIESVRSHTVNWLRINVEPLRRPGWIDKHLIMRPDGDFRHDTEVKPEQLKKAGIDLEDIAFVLEDRNSMVAKWRELGIRCLQVNEGDF